MSPAIGTHDEAAERLTDLEYAARRGVLLGHRYADEEITKREFLAELARLRELIEGGRETN